MEERRMLVDFFSFLLLLLLENQFIVQFDLPENFERGDLMTV